MILCHYRDHSYTNGACLDCGNTKEEIDRLYAFYYPTFKPAGEVREAHSDVVAGNL
jgi:hypothetical protein